MEGPNTPRPRPPGTEPYDFERYVLVCAGGEAIYEYRRLSCGSAAPIGAHYPSQAAIMILNGKAARGYTLIIETPEALAVLRDKVAGVPKCILVGDEGRSICRDQGPTHDISEVSDCRPYAVLWWTMRYVGGLADVVARKLARLMTMDRDFEELDLVSDRGARMLAGARRQQAEKDRDDDDEEDRPYFSGDDQ